MSTVARPGQPLQIRADEYNAATEAGAAHAARERSQRLEIVDPRTRAPDLIRIRNATEEQFALYDVVELTIPVIAPADSARGWTDGLPAMDAVTPTSPAAAIRGKLAILSEPIGPGQTRVAIASAVCRTRLTLCDPSHTHAAPIAGTRRLASTADTGAPIEILWAAEPAEPEGDDEPDLTVEALVRISNAHETVTAFRLTTRAEALDDFPQTATRIDADGEPYGEPFEVRTPEILKRLYGPADVGFQGWAVYKSAAPAEGDPCGAGYWQIVHMQRFANYIKFSNADFSGGCIVAAEAESYWHGEEPVWQIAVDASHLNCACLGSDATGIAVLDEKQSAYPWLIYRVIDIDQMLYTSDAADCASNPCDTGTPTRVLIAGDGLSLERLECGAIPCAAVLHWQGLEVLGTACESDDEPGSGTPIQKLIVNAPLEMEVIPGCPAIGTLRLAEGLIKADNTDECVIVTVTYSNCEYTIGVTFDRECLENSVAVTVLAGTCITVEEDTDEEGRKTYTVNNAMKIAAGECISVEGDGCDLTINNTMKIVAGECISVEGDGCDLTINNTMRVVGGNGIQVQRDGCTFSVNLNGSIAEPKTTLRILCGIEITPIQISCVEDSEGNWGFSVSGGEVTEHFTTLEIPSALIAVSSECAPGYDGGGGGIDPPIEPPPDGEWVTIHAINCDGPTGFPYVSWTFNGWPPGATSCEIQTDGDMGSFATIGPFDQYGLQAGQEYWGALDDRFGPVNPGESFTFTVIFKDATGNVISTAEWSDVYTCP